VWPSSTNFLLFSVGAQTPTLHQHLQECDIAVRDVGAHPLLANCLRVTVSNAKDNAAFVSTVREFLTRS